MCECFQCTGNVQSHAAHIDLLTQRGGDGSVYQPALCVGFQK